MLSVQSTEAPQRYLIYGVYPKHLFPTMAKIFIACSATEDTAEDLQELHRGSRIYRNLEITIQKHLEDRGDYASEVYHLALAFAKIFGIPCIRYEAWLLEISMEFVHDGVWMGLV